MGRKLQEKTKKKNREKTRDQEATFVEIKEETESKRLVKVRKKTGGSSLSFPSPSSLFRDLYKQSPGGKTAESEDREECGRS